MAESWTKITVGDSVDAIPDSSDVSAVVDSCPPETLDVELNLENRKNAIDSAMYGPLNPAEPNDEYWTVLADEWRVDISEARKQTCGNCAMFNISPSMKDCIAEGVGPDRFDLVDAAGELGYCEAFDFKCASARTCRAWVAGGPVTEDRILDEAAAQMQGEDPCWDGYMMIGMKKKGNRMVPNCVPKDSAVAREYVSSQSLFDGASSRIFFGESAELDLEKKLKEYNSVFGVGEKRADLDTIRAVYRRGARSMTSSGYSSKSRHEWGMDRVDAFLKLLRSGKPYNSMYIQDNDLLPVSHPSREEATVMTASGSVIDNSKNLREYIESQVLTDIRPRASDYSSLTEAVLSITEASGLGYESEINVKAAWLRAVDESKDPYNMAKNFGFHKEDSEYFDLFPAKNKEE